METPYSPLASTHHIRILKLSKNSLGQVEVELQAVDLQAGPEYTCLSYTWGPPTWEDEGEEWTIPSHSVLVNGHSFAIGLNLRNALSHLHEILADRAIWIDAICINQQDVAERNAQVALMNRIYGQARDVVVWLGEATPAYEVAIKNMDRFTFTLEKYWKVFPDGDKAWRDAFVASELTKEEHVQIIHFLADNRWFSRMWTMQEHTLAREIWFLCGDVLVSVETIWKGSMIAVLGTVTGAWAELGARREQWNKDFSSAVPLIYRFKHEALSSLSLGINAHTYRHRQATDPKDKVYGVVGISRTTDKWINEPFVVDYSLTVQEIYTQAALYGLVAWEGLEALCHVGDRTQNEIPDLPSWVPDFTQALPWKAFQKGEHHFKAASSLATELWADGVKDGVIVFNASPIDSIVCTCDAYWNDREKNGLSEFMKLLFRSSAPATPYDEDTASLILRLVTADGFKNLGIDPRENLKELFELWLFSGLFACDEAHRGSADSAIAFWKDPQGRIAPMAEALGIRCDLLETLIEPISRGAKVCQTIEDIELAFQGRSREEGALARYLPSTRHQLANQWEFTGKSRCFFRTAQGYVGIGPRTIEEGDGVMLLQGAHVPYIFRHQPKDPETVFDFVGEAYLHGFMYGEALEKEGLKWEKITVY